MLSEYWERLNRQYYLSRNGRFRLRKIRKHWHLADLFTGEVYRDGAWVRMENLAFQLDAILRDRHACNDAYPKYNEMFVRGRDT